MEAAGCQHSFDSPQLSNQTGCRERLPSCSRSKASMSMCTLNICVCVYIYTHTFANARQGTATFSRASGAFKWIWCEESKKVPAEDTTKVAAATTKGSKQPEKAAVKASPRRSLRGWHMACATTALWWSEGRSASFVPAFSLILLGRGGSSSKGIENEGYVVMNGKPCSFQKHWRCLANPWL